MQVIGIGVQDFGKIRENNLFYVDKTELIREWWENKDDVTLIARPRRFGKTLTMDMLEKFFSVNYSGRSDLFEGLKIWKDEKYHKLQGTYPVIFLSFASVKEQSYEEARLKIGKLIVLLYRQYDFLLESEILNEKEKEDFLHMSEALPDYEMGLAIQQLSNYLYQYYGKKVLILLDEYDTPMQEAYVNGYWEKFTAFVRNLFNATFKTNPYLERAIMTGVTRVSKESVFSDLNNLEVVTTTSEKYRECFGFTQTEVFHALNEYGLGDTKQEVKAWYDGFIFGGKEDIYNPWSIINFLDKKRLGAYWANTSSNSLIGKLLREGTTQIKQEFEYLIQGKTLEKEIDEQVVYNQLGQEENALWSLLLASGYLKALHFHGELNEYGEWEERYELALTNFEVKTMFRKMIKNWFGSSAANYNEFINALLSGNLKEMNAYMNRVALDTFSYFDVGREPSRSEPERFYHGFVLGLIVELNHRYIIRSNHESGFGRYDVMLEPRDTSDNGMILEFKVRDASEEKDLEATVLAALQQIEDKKYEESLLAKGISADRIQKYGFAFQGKTVMIGKK